MNDKNVVSHIFMVHGMVYKWSLQCWCLSWWYLFKFI